MNSRLGVAFVGAGDVAQRDYLPEFHRLDDRCRLISVMSRSKERASSVAALYGAERWSTEISAVTQDPEVDIVVNLTPVPMHHAVSMAAIRGGKHLYSEKPIADTLRQADEIAMQADRSGVAVVAAPSVMVFPQVRALADLLRDGELGEVSSVRATAVGGVPPWEGYMSNPTPFFARGAGPLRDMGVYPLHTLVGLFGALSTVTASARQTIDKFVLESGPYAGITVPVETADEWHLICETQSGLIADVHATFASNGGLAPDFEVLGRQGAAGISLLDVSAPIHLLTAEGERKSIPVHHDRVSGPDHILGVEHLVDHLSTGSPLVLTAALARHVLAAIEAAERSAVQSGTIAVK
jgi:predicted dehydrogenase